MQQVMNGHYLLCGKRMVRAQCTWNTFRHASAQTCIQAIATSDLCKTNQNSRTSISFWIAIDGWMFSRQRTKA